VVHILSDLLSTTYLQYFVEQYARKHQRGSTIRQIVISYSLICFLSPSFYQAFINHIKLSVWCFIFSPGNLQTGNNNYEYIVNLVERCVPSRAIGCVLYRQGRAPCMAIQEVYIYGRCTTPYTVYIRYYMLQQHHLVQLKVWKWILGANSIEDFSLPE
jgi:hypothetical protein